MRRIRRRDTRPELQLRRILFAAGLRYRLTCPTLPFRPDLVFPGKRVAVFVHGCFWHGHGCALFRWPRANAAFWWSKISRNRARDARVELAMSEAGFRTLIVWECAMRGPARLQPRDLVAVVQGFLSASELPRLEVVGRRDQSEGDRPDRSS